MANSCLARGGGRAQVLQDPRRLQGVRRQTEMFPQREWDTAAASGREERRRDPDRETTRREFTQVSFTCRVQSFDLRARMLTSRHDGNAVFAHDRWISAGQRSSERLQT